MSRSFSQQEPKLRLNSGLLSPCAAPLWGSASLEGTPSLTTLPCGTLPMTPRYPNGSASGKPLVNNWEPTGSQVKSVYQQLFNVIGFCFCVNWKLLQLWRLSKTKPETSAHKWTGITIPWNFGDARLHQVQATSISNLVKEKTKCEYNIDLSLLRHPSSFLF